MPTRISWPFVLHRATFYAAACSTLVALQYCSRTATAANPGFRVVLTANGLDYVRQVAVPILEKELSSLSIPDITGRADTPIGSVDYALTKIQLSELKIPTSSLKSSSQDGLVVQASDISLHVYADWHYREDDWPHIEDHGNCDINVYEVSVQMYIRVAADSTGHAVLSTYYCHLYIGKLDIDFHDGASWLYNLFSEYISDDLKGSIEDQVCSAAVEEINTQGNQALASIPVDVEVSSTVEIDFAMVDNPILTSSYVQSNNKGEFYDTNHPVEAPFTPSSLPPVTESSSMLYMWLTEYMANTAGFVFLSTGQLHYVITPSMVPPSIPFQLNTSDFKYIVPQLYDKFPNWGMELELNATKPPLLTLSASGGNFTVFGDILVQVLRPGNSSDKELAFVLGAVVYAGAKFYLNSQNMVCGNTSFLKIDLSLVSTNIGELDVDALQAAANLLSILFIIPSINHYANAGVPFPSMDGVSLTHASLKMGEGYILVAGDLVYSP